MGHLELDELLWDLPHGKAQRVKRELLHPLPCATHSTQEKDQHKHENPSTISQAAIQLFSEQEFRNCLSYC